jgi:Ca-activated chloride channel family protein
MIEWANFQDIYWLAAIPCILLMLLIIQHRSEKVFHTWFNKNQYGKHHPVLKYFLLAGGVSLSGLALLGPAWGNNNRTVNIMGREIYFLLDVSASMNCKDLAPSRLEKVKSELRKVIRDMRGDKMGLIVYTSQGFVQCPLTTDARMVEMLLKVVQTNQFSNTGTDLRAGLSKCLERFSAEPRFQGKKLSRAVVLLTDGEDFGDKYTSVLLRLRQQGVSVIPVSVGSPGGAPVPVSSDENANLGTAISKVNPQTALDIAKQTGQQAFTLSSSNSSLSALSQYLQNLPATVVDEQEEKNAANQYQWFLGLAILMGFSALYFIPVRR